VPALQIGVWNGWIFTLCLVLRRPLIRLINKDVWERVGAPARACRTKTERAIRLLSEVTRFSIFGYSLFLPLRLDTHWFYVGLPVCITGAILYTIAWINLATTPREEPATRGLYRYSRHPMHLTPFLTLLGLSIVTSSFIFLMLSLLFILLRCITVLYEEQFWLERYGDTYLEYMRRTPRWVGLPKFDPSGSR
jgi:protein-S-isoprenylcysteine O-methyltransferase Ste14